MTLREANYEVERLTNDLNRLLKEKEVVLHRGGTFGCVA